MNYRFIRLCMILCMLFLMCIVHDTESANTFNDDTVLVTFVLDKERMFRLIDEPGDTFAVVGRTPGQVGTRGGH